MAGRRLLADWAIAGAAVLFFPAGLAAQEMHRPPQGKIQEAIRFMEQGDAAGLEAFIQRLPSEKRARFRENLERWKTMTPEQRQAIRSQEGFRRKKLRAEAERAISDSGLSLPEERKADFVRAYQERRRKIEERLFREMEEKRKPLLEQMARELAAEFSTPAASPEPAGSPVVP